MDGVVGSLCGEHAALHRVVRPFDFGYVDKPGGTADEGATGEVELGDRLKAALVEHAGRISEALTRCEEVAVVWVVFHAL